MTESIIYAMSNKDNDAADYDNNDAGSFVLSITGMKNCTKLWWVAKGVTQQGLQIRIGNLNTSNRHITFRFGTTLYRPAIYQHWKYCGQNLF